MSQTSDRTSKGRTAKCTNKQYSPSEKDQFIRCFYLRTRDIEKRFKYGVGLKDVARHLASQITRTGKAEPLKTKASKFFKPDRMPADDVGKRLPSLLDMSWFYKTMLQVVIAYEASEAKADEFTELGTRDTLGKRTPLDDGLESLPSRIRARPYEFGLDGIDPYLEYENFEERMANVPQLCHETSTTQTASYECLDLLEPMDIGEYNTTLPSLVQASEDPFHLDLPGSHFRTGDQPKQSESIHDEHNSSDIFFL